MYKEYTSFYCFRYPYKSVFCTEHRKGQWKELFWDYTLDVEIVPKIMAVKYGNIRKHLQIELTAANTVLWPTF